MTANILETYNVITNSSMTKCVTICYISRNYRDTYMFQDGKCADLLANIRSMSASILM